MKYNLLLLLTVLIFAACNNNTEQKSDSNANAGLIEISKAQFESEKMTLAEAVLNSFPSTVSFTGQIRPDVNGQALISLSIPGKINKILYEPGDYVAKNAVLFEVSGNAFIDLQKEFAESAAICAKLKSDYDRAKELFDENIASKKDFKWAESAYNAEYAKCKSLKMKLENTGTDVSRIEKGEFYKAYQVLSPMSGYITNFEVVIGQNVEPLQKIAEVVNANTYQIKLSIFEKDINKIKPNQQVAFYLNSDKNEKFTAKIVSVGKTISDETKSVACYATIDNIQKTNVVNNQYVEGEVIISAETSMSVPEAAIINSENTSYILVFEKLENNLYYFKKTKVELGRKYNKYVELKDTLVTQKILSSGAYNIQL